MEIIEELQVIFREIFDEDDLVISRDTVAEDIEDWDSLTHMQLIIEIEKRYGIKFSTAEIKKAANVGEFIDIIKGKL
jgi:acyl carrier protein